MTKTWSAGSQTFHGFKVPARPADAVNHPKQPPIDHFDLMAEYMDEEHKRSEVEKKRERLKVAETWRAGLDNQVAHQHQAKAREKAEDKEFLQKCLAEQAKAEESLKAADDAEAAKKAKMLEEQRRLILAASETAAAKKLRQQQQVKREGDQMQMALERDRKFDERQQAALKEKKANDIKVLTEACDLVNDHRRQKKLDDQDYENQIFEQAKQMAIKAGEERSQQYAKSQAVMDHIYSTLGARNAQQRAKQERDFDERIDRAFEEQNRKNYESYWTDAEDKSRKTHQATMMNRTMTLDFSKRSLSEKEEDRVMADRWRREAEESIAKESEAKSKLKKAMEDTSISNWSVFQERAGVHPRSLVAPEKIRRELAYNGLLLKNMVDQEFNPDMSQPLSMQATHKMALRPKPELGKARRHVPL